MGTAYTPGLKVSARTTVEKLRRLPLKGEVVVKQGDTVTPHTVVARTELPGIMQTAKLAERMGIEASDLASALRVKVGDSVAVGDILAETKGLFGKFFPNGLNRRLMARWSLSPAQPATLGFAWRPRP